MEVKFREKFEKDLESISDSDVLSAIEEVINNVEEAKKPQEIIKITKMKGDKTAFRIKMNNKYRIGVYIIKGIVEFTRVLPRDKIYKYFPD
jgi:mRNA-degrading endonuclease RelE of RelBE toxin-antitoxin system